ncbi:hypothetical protein BDN71DRAFT_1456575 [Pleurotus eryngii]|uniref:Ser-Thr-rich glycosyl-phosphatidyl-inositol-anchored membrane family-domain-containing protein n=1 Tax=Pleurotus eryngii TaxID=5323 RepID=A0A9P6D9W9_PLEER|nr:hypothetical protein BDN71DRAFT_1456575 [Pleurotus eryngii]
MLVSVYTLAFFAALAGALQIQPLQNANSQGDTRITWINDAADASRFSTFSVFLHHPTFNSDFALLNNQRPTDGGANVTLPAVPAQDGYTLRATDISNINNEFAVSAPFAIGPEVSPASSLAPSTSAPISGSVTGSGAATNTAVATPRGSGSGSILSVPTVSPTASSPASRASGASGGSGTATAAQGGATNFNGAPSASVGMKAWALGAAVLALRWVAGGY